MQLRWLLVWGFVAAATVECLAPVLLGWWIARRFRAAWRFWFLGAGVFLLFQGLTRIPLMIAIQSHPAVREALQQPWWRGSFLFAAAASAGLMEEGGRWVAYRWFIPPEQRRFPTALMLGAGHGGLESIGIGVLVAFSLVGYLTLVLAPPTQLSPEQMAAAQAQFQALASWEPLLGAWERLATLVVHLALSVMVLLSFRRGGVWWWAALAAHTMVNFSTAGVLIVARRHLSSRAAAVVAELAVTGWAVAALAFLWAARRRLREEAAPAESAPEEAAPENAGN